MKFQYGDRVRLKKKSCELTIYMNIPKNAVGIVVGFVQEYENLVSVLWGDKVEFCSRQDLYKLGELDELRSFIKNVIQEIRRFAS